jgi:hypothetical protein
MACFAYVVAGRQRRRPIAQAQVVAISMRIRNATAPRPLSALAIEIRLAAPASLRRSIISTRLPKSIQSAVLLPESTEGNRLVLADQSQLK